VIEKEELKLKNSEIETQSEKYLAGSEETIDDREKNF